MYLDFYAVLQQRHQPNRPQGWEESPELSAENIIQAVEDGTWEEIERSFSPPREE